MIPLITYQDYLQAVADNNVTKWLQGALSEYTFGKEYKKALMEAEYMAGRDTAIMEMVKKIYDMTGTPMTDFTAANNRISSNLFHRLIMQRCSYLLGNGVTFPDEVAEGIKAELGDRFDNRIFKAAYWARGNGESYTYVHKAYNVDKWEFDVFKKTEFLPLYDEMTNVLRGGIRFWSLNWQQKPIVAVLYLENGYQRYESKDGQTGFGSLEPVGKLTSYVETVQESEAGGTEVINGENYSSIPIVPLYSGENRTSDLDNLKPKIDALDMAISGFANDMQDVAQVYWVVNGAMGATDDELTKMRDKARLLHILNYDGDNSKIEPVTQEPPYNARETFIQKMIERIYADYGALNVTQVSGQQRTATEIEAAYQPMDEEADEFEYQLIEYIQQILRIMGLPEVVPQFFRNRIANQKEQTQMVMMAANYLDDRTILELLPFVTIDKIDGILEARNVSEYDRMEDEESQQSEENDEIDQMIKDGLDDTDDDSEIFSEFDKLQEELDALDEEEE